MFLMPLIQGPLVSDRVSSSNERTKEYTRRSDFREARADESAPARSLTHSLF